MLQAPKPSPDVLLASRTRVIDILSAIVLSSSLSFVLGLVINPPFSIFLFVALAVAAKALSDNRQINLGNLQTLFNSRQSVPQDPLAQKVQARLRLAEEAAQRLREQYDREAGNERWGAERFELLNRKETYKNLAQIRQFKLQQLEAEPRQNQLDEFLDQFEIKDAEIKGVVPPVKMALLSHGIETAADVVEEVRRIPSVGRSQAERLLEWRRDLERNFVYDPGRGVSPQARVNVEREVDALRFRIECELSAGANNLRRMKHDIETSRQKLQPALANARQELAQAEKDWKIASRRKPFAPILLALFIAFIIGTSLKYENNERVVYPGTKTERQEPPSDSSESARTSSSGEREIALKQYDAGAALSANGKYEEAITFFKKATEFDPNFSDAYVSLGYALYRLGRYNESIDASWRATYIKGDFAPYYNLGLAYMSREDWFEARDAFGSAVTYCKVNPWHESYSYAYYYLGLSQARDGSADIAIEALRKELADNPQTAITRFELGALYLGCGRYKDARAQYKILKNLDPMLAEELRKLIEKHAARKLA
jgi:tetratricopeptide (TPR) repeat protein